MRDEFTWRRMNKEFLKNIYILKSDEDFTEAHFEHIKVMAVYKHAEPFTENFECHYGYVNWLTARSVKLGRVTLSRDDYEFSVCNA